MADITLIAGGSSVLLANIPTTNGGGGFGFNPETSRMEGTAYNWYVEPFPYDTAVGYPHAPALQRSLGYNPSGGANGGYIRIDPPFEAATPPYDFNPAVNPVVTYTNAPVLEGGQTVGNAVPTASIEVRASAATPQGMYRLNVSFATQLSFPNGVFSTFKDGLSVIMWITDGVSAPPDPPVLSNPAGCYGETEQFSWVAVPGALFYTFYRDGVVIADNLTQTQYADSGLTAGQNYQWTLTVTTANGTSAASLPLFKSPCYPAPPPPPDEPDPVPVPAPRGCCCSDWKPSRLPLSGTWARVNAPKCK